jgi:hypothetical protein
VDSNVFDFVVSAMRTHKKLSVNISALFRAAALEHAKVWILYCLQFSLIFSLIIVVQKEF